jgi:DNA-binding SARP family transcriptional activator
MSRNGGQATSLVMVEGSTDGSDQIRVNLLGGLTVQAGGVTLGPRQLGGTKPRHVLLALLLNRGAPVPKERLISLLWGEHRPAGATSTLETYVCVLRKKLQPSAPARSSLIRTVAGCYSIDMSCVDLDVARYESLMTTGMSSEMTPDEALPRLREALTLIEASLLPEEDDTEWLGETRRVHDLHIQEDLVAAAAKVAHVSPSDSSRWSRMALDADPLNEAAWYTYLLSKLASGQHADGLRAYDRCRRLFASELGCAPGLGLQELYERLLLEANNDDDDELRCLFDAVLRLHKATAAGVASVELGDGFDYANPQNCSLAKACRTLDGLLRSVEGPQRVTSLADPRQRLRSVAG